jgi:hypothetical protein
MHSASNKRDAAPPILASQLEGLGNLYLSFLVNIEAKRSWSRRQLFTAVGSATLTAQIDQATNILQRGPFI